MTTTTRVTPINYNSMTIRELIVGPNEPISPFPIKLLGWVQMGFGRGSKDLGCPTANLPDDAIIPYQHQLGTGVYYGYATILHHTLDDDDTIVHPMVMSIGWNPTYNNNKKTAEVHILHKYQNDFYGKELRVIILGYIRPEFKYPNFDSLIKDINFDKQVAAASVDRPGHSSYQSDPFFFAPSNLPPQDPSLLTRLEEPKEDVEAEKL